MRPLLIILLASSFAFQTALPRICEMVCSAEAGCVTECDHGCDVVAAVDHHEVPAAPASGHSHTNCTIHQGQPKSSDTARVQVPPMLLAWPAVEWTCVLDCDRQCLIEPLVAVPPRPPAATFSTPLLI